MENQKRESQSMKAIFLCEDTKQDEKFNGVNKKISSQLEGLRSNGIDAVLHKLKRLPKLVRVLPFQSSSLDWKQVSISSDIDLVYIRNSMADYQFLHSLKLWKEKHPALKIIIEMPSFPYDMEAAATWNKLVLWRDRHYRKFLKKYVDRIVVFTDHETVFGIKAIQAVNGIDVNKVQMIKPISNSSQSINVVAVALISFWHGYDRFIEGLFQYYKEGGSREIVLHLVGDGPATPELKQLVKKLKLEKYVIFYGTKSGTALDVIYDRADIGLDVLGSHRKGDRWFGSLKSREYLAKGLPFVTEYPLPDAIEPVKQYILKVPYDDSPIDMEELIRFNNRVHSQSWPDIIDKMRGFARCYCDVNVVMNPVCDYIKSKQ